MRLPCNRSYRALSSRSGLSVFKIRGGTAALFMLFAAIILGRLLDLYGFGQLSSISRAICFALAISFATTQIPRIRPSQTILLVVGAMLISGFISFAKDFQVERIYFWLPFASLTLLLGATISATKLPDIQRGLTLASVLGLVVILPVVRYYIPNPTMAVTRDLLNENQLAMYLLSFVVLLFVSERKILAWSALAVTFAIAVLVASRGTMIASVLLLFVAILLQRLNFIALGKAIFSMITLIATSPFWMDALNFESFMKGEDLAISGRALGSQNSFRNFSEAPFVGMGVPADLDLNSYTQILGQHGLLGLVVTIFWIAMALRSGLKRGSEKSIRWALAGFVSILFYSFFEPILGSFGNPIGISLIFLGAYLLTKTSPRSSEVWR